jgi:CRP/FNR family cyclic AMP-dependent transcriptional regulator
MIPFTVLTAIRQTPAVDRKHHFPVFLQGELPLGLWLLEAGSLLISRLAEGGRTVILEVLEPGDLVGLAATVSGLPYEVGAETAEPCRLRLLPRCEFLKILRCDEESSTAIAWLLSVELAAAHRWIGNTMLTRASSTRLARLILHAAPGELATLTHLNLAERIGVSRECVTRMVQILKSTGALSAERGPLLVLDRKVLRKMAV